MQSDAESSLRHNFSSHSRRIKKVGKQFLVPSKYDSDGNLVTSQTPDVKKIARYLTLHDWRFLECWKRHDWDTDKARQELGFTHLQVKRLVKRVSVFREEEVKDKALSAIPTTSWVQARHVENVLGSGQLGDSERDSLKELAKITGAYKSNSINLTQNVFNLPEFLTPEDLAKLKVIGDEIAIKQDAIETEARVA